MGLQDLIITPIYLAFFLLIAYYVRPNVTTKATRKYFIPALLVRFVGAISLGVLYQFYYSGSGDTFNYYNQAGIIHEAFLKDPVIAFKLLFSDVASDPEVYQYASRIRWYDSSAEFFIVGLTSLLSIITHHTYSAISLFFASFSFVGLWLLFKAINHQYKGLTKPLMIAIFFIPTTIIWGSGILKDTLTLGALGATVWSAFQVIERKEFSIKNVIVFVFGVWLLFIIKIYILLCLFPALLVWWYLKNISSIRSTVLKALVIPFLFLLVGFFGFSALNSLAETSDRYKLNDLAKWSYITSNDIRYWTGKDAGSGYDIGAQDGTWEALLALVPSAINVTLFRPYLWEVSNPLMLVSAIESFSILILTLFAFFSLRRQSARQFFMDPTLVMFILFSVAFAFAVGASTYNFGTLSRYKIPLIPFYVSSMFILVLGSKIPRKPLRT